MGSSVLALLVALVSVVALAAPALKTLVTPENSKVEVKLQRLHKESIHLLVVNRGIRPGSVRSVAYNISIPRRTDWGRELEVAPIIVQPNSATQIIAAIETSDRSTINDELWLALAQKDRDDFKFSVEVYVVQFDGTRTKLIIPVLLADILNYTGTKWNDCLLGEFLADETNAISLDPKLPSQQDVYKKCGSPTSMKSGIDGGPVAGSAAQELQF